jgi:hypothetical protein
VGAAGKEKQDQTWDEQGPTPQRITSSEPHKTPPTGKYFPPRIQDPAMISLLTYQTYHFIGRDFTHQSNCVKKRNQEKPKKQESNPTCYTGLKS